MAAKRSVSPGPIDLMKVSPPSSPTTFSAVVSDVAFTVSFSRRARASRPSKTRTTRKTCNTRTGDEVSCVARTGRRPRSFVFNFYSSCGMFLASCISNNLRSQYNRSINVFFFFRERSEGTLANVQQF